MLIGAKPQGWSLENKSRQFWNKLELEISNAHTTAVVTHWTPGWLPGPAPRSG